MALSNDPTFSGIVDTQDLQRDCIICLAKGNQMQQRPNYVFKFLKPLNPITKTHLRVRFLIPNFIGVLKAYEIKIAINEFTNQCVTVIPKKPK
jgi:hypothetical protein